MLFLTVTSCVKDPMLNHKDFCYQFADLPKHFDYVGANAICYSYPEYNPNNPNEFLHLKGCGSVPEDSQGIYVYNMLTKREKAVFLGDIWEWPKWGRKGWIVFGIQQQLYKIREDGTGLTQLTFQGENYSPQWNYDGDQIIYRITRKTPPVYSTAIVNLEGEIVDSLHGIAFGLGDWNEDNHIVTQLYPGGAKQIRIMRAFPLDTVRTIPLISQSENDYISHMGWIPNTDDFVWCRGDGVYRTNYITGSTKKVIDGCETHNYISLSVSPDGQNILTKVTSWRINDEIGKIEAFSEVWLIDIDGNNERRILPE